MSIGGGIFALLLVVITGQTAKAAGGIHHLSAAYNLKLKEQAGLTSSFYEQSFFRNFQPYMQRDFPVNGGNDSNKYSLGFKFEISGFDEMKIKRQLMKVNSESMEILGRQKEVGLLRMLFQFEQKRVLYQKLKKISESYKNLRDFLSQRLSRGVTAQWPVAAYLKSQKLVEGILKLQLEVSSLENQLKRESKVLGLEWQQLPRAKSLSLTDIEGLAKKIDETAENVFSRQEVLKHKYELQATRLEQAQLSQWVKDIDIKLTNERQAWNELSLKVTFAIPGLSENRHKSIELRQKLHDLQLESSQKEAEVPELSLLKAKLALNLELHKSQSKLIEGKERIAQLNLNNARGADIDSLLSLRSDFFTREVEMSYAENQMALDLIDLLYYSGNTEAMKKIVGVL